MLINLNCTRTTKKLTSKYYIALFLVLLTQITNAQFWIQKTVGNNLVKCSNSILDTDGHSFICGYYIGNASFGTYNLPGTNTSDIFIASTDSIGNYLWAISFNGPGTNRANSITIDSAGNIYVTGFFNSVLSFGSTTLTSSGSQDVFVVKMSASGQVIWAKQFGGSQSDIGISIDCQKTRNSVIIYGQFKGTSTFSSNVLNSTNNSIDIFILSLYQANGAVEWIKQGASNQDIHAIDLSVNSNNEIVLIGRYSDTIQFSQTFNNASQNAIFLAKLDTLGNSIWLNRISGSQYNVARDLTIDLNDNIYLTGDFYNNLNVSGTSNILSGEENFKSFVLKISSSGDVIWMKKIYSENYITAASVAVDNYQNLWISGSFNCSFSQMQSFYDIGVFLAKGDKDLFAIKMNSNGNIVYGQQISSNSDIDVLNTNVHNDELFLCSSYLGKPIIPLSENFNLSALSSYDSVICDSNTNYCNDSEYGHFISINNSTTENLLFGKLIDTDRSTYDFFIRSGNSCYLGLPTLNIEATGSICDSSIASIMVSEILCPFLSPNYSLSGYSITISSNNIRTYKMLTPVNSCLPSFKDSADLSLFPNNLQIPLISDNVGINSLELNPNDITFCGSNPVILYTLSQNGSSVSWSCSNQVLNIDTFVLAPVTGAYEAIATDSNGCTQSNSVNVVFYDTLPEMLFKLHLDDTVNYCSNNIKFTDFWIYDSLSNPNAQMNCITEYYSNTSIEMYSIESTITPGGVALQASIVCGNIGQIWAIETGMAYVNIELMYYNDCDTLYYAFIDSVYINILPSPVPDTFNFSIQGPTNLCPFDTIQLVAFTDSTFNWFGPNVSGLNTDTVFITTPGTYVISFYFTDTNQNGCYSTSIGFAQHAVSQYSVPEITSDKLYLCPSDSFNLTVSTVLNNPDFQWQGPFGNFGANSAQVTAFVPGNYYCLVSNSECSIESNTIHVEGYSTPEITISGSNVICNDSSVSIQVNSNFVDSIQWLNPLSGTGNSQIITSAGIYQCEILSCGIQTISSIEIIESTNSLSIIAQGPLCKDSFAVLEADKDFDSYQWVPSFDSLKSFQITDTGWFTLNVIDSNGCRFIDSLNVISTQQFASFTSSDSFNTCLGDTIFLASASGLVNPTWMPVLDTNSSISIWQNSSLWLQAADSNGCISTSDTVSINFNSNRFSLQIDDSLSLCSGEVFTIEITDTNISNIRWMPSFSEGNLLSISQSGIYFAHAIDSAGCQLISDSAFVILKEKPALPPFQINHICLNEQINLQSLSKEKLFLLTLPDLMVVDSGNSVNIIPKVGVNEFLLFALIESCSSDTLHILVDTIGCDLFIPNVITPNGDGINDQFLVQKFGWECFSLQIFNRWGTLVFESNNPEIAWDGYLPQTGEIVSEGVYYYSIRYCNENEEYINGSFQLLR